MRPQYQRTQCSKHSKQAGSTEHKTRSADMAGQGCIHLHVTCGGRGVHVHLAGLLQACSVHRPSLPAEAAWQRLPMTTDKAPSGFASDC